MLESRSVLAIISLGSNIAPARNLPEAIRKLNETTSVNLLKTSSVYESAPVGFADQDNFCNAAALVETSLDPRELKFTVLRRIENELGRVRDPENKNGPRTIDLDIGLYGNFTINEADLNIPDPEITVRSFLALPFAEIAPDLIPPTAQIPLAEIARQTEGLQHLRLRDDVSLQSILSGELPS